jgi:hypothetical protein
MDMKKSLVCCFCCCIVLLAGCGPQTAKDEIVVGGEGADSLAVVNSSIDFTLMEESNEFPDAIIEMYAPLSNQTFSPGKIPFEFNIKNYPFGEEPSHPQLFLITNGADPVGHQSPIFQLEFKEGTYRTVAYLVDSQGICLKEFGNYVDRDFLVGNSRPFPYSAEPYIALNLPRNNQAYAEGEDVIVDFLLIGGDMLMDQLKVVVKVGTREFEVNDVVPLSISKLPKGEHLVQLELRKQDGKVFDGPFSSVQKSILVQ